MATERLCQVHGRRRGFSGAGPFLPELAPSANDGSPACGAGRVDRHHVQPGSLIDDNMAVAHRARALCQPGVLQLPLPGRGATLVRWQTLASVAIEDLCVAKIEAHAASR